MDPADIIAHAASLTEADLAAILRAKCPNQINGYPLAIVSMWCASDYTTIGLHVAGECVAGERSIDEAVARLSAKVSSPKDRADQKRRYAAEILAEANKLDPQ